LSEEQLVHFRRETAGKGLSSYCHSYLMPRFWQFPNASMGLGPINAIYQARFMRYLQNRGILPLSDRRVWAFIGDGEMDEPESLGGLSIAAREELDNLIFVINCNLQRLDGPVRGNGSIIQELEGLFNGYGWNVIKLLWGSDWDPIFARDTHDVLLRRFEETVDGQMQTYAATDARFNREHFFNKYPELAALIADLSDDEVDNLHRGGHDPIKIYAAYDAAVRTRGRPTVILAQTKKGFGLGHWGQGKMTAHQRKKLEYEALVEFRDRFELPLKDADLRGLQFVKPSDDAPEMRYLRERRVALGGFLPARDASAPLVQVPQLELLDSLLNGSGERELSTTMAFVQLLRTLLRDPNLKSKIVPIVADEARTFGMEALFRQVGIYSPSGQLYDPEDKDQLSYYKEAREGQILEEGITEAGALSSWIAAATSYSVHGEPMLPFYIFYSMFGFQRVGDLIWAAADSRSRGFLIGATSGRTTLSGEGLQHQDGTSHLVASTIPTCKAYDPAFSHELAVIVREGMRRMLEAQEDVFYYVTVMNENYRHPALPPGTEEGILRGMYLLRAAGGARVQLLAGGTILREALAAAEILEREHNVPANVWSVTSWTELRWEAMRAPERAIPWVTACLAATGGPIVAASDYVTALPDLVRAWIPSGRQYVTLGTDGFGMSDTRAALREHFGVNAAAIVRAALSKITQIAGS